MDFTEFLNSNQFEIKISIRKKPIQFTGFYIIEKWSLMY